MTISNFWGNNPSTTTIVSSPAPTQTNFTLLDATDFLEGQNIFVQVDGVLERTHILSKSGNSLTVSPALSSAPDVPGLAQSGRELITNSRLNSGSLFNAESVSELAAVDTTLAPDGLKYLIKNVGLYRFAFSSSATADNFMVIEPETGPGRWLLESTGNLWQIEAQGPSEATNMNPPADGVSWGSMFQRNQLQKLDLDMVRNGSYLFNNESERPQIYIDGRWYSFMLERSDYDLSGIVTNTLSGTIEDGVTITIDQTQQQGETDENGLYSIANVSKGSSVALTASKAGYNSYIGTVNLNSGDATKNFTIARRTLSGTVSSSGGVGLQGATVQIASPSRSSITDSDGYYELIDVPDGSYLVTASHGDYSAYTSGSIDVSSDVEHDFIMNVLTAIVSGTVTSSATNQVISGANVNIAGQPTVITDGSGNYSRSDVPRLYGQSMNVTADYFNNYSSTINVTGSSVSKNINLIPQTLTGMNFNNITWRGDSWMNSRGMGVQISLSKTIQAVGVRGFLRNNGNTRSVMVTVYSNSNVQLAQISGTWNSTTGWPNTFSEADLTFSSPITLSAGTYWLEVFVTPDNGISMPVAFNYISSPIIHIPGYTTQPYYYYHNNSSASVPSGWASASGSPLPFCLLVKY